MLFRNVRMALRGIWMYRGRSLLAILGVAVAALLVISMMTVLYNFSQSLLQQFSGLGARQITVVPGKLLNKKAIDSGISDFASFAPSASTLTYKDAMDVKARVPGVEKAAPQNEFMGVLMYNKKGYEMIFTGTTPDLLPILDVRLADGRFFTDAECKQNKHVIVLGANIKYNIFGDRPAVGKTVTINRENFMVIGVLDEKKMFGFNIDDRVYAPYHVVEKIGNVDNASLLFFTAKKTENVPQVEKQINNVIGQNHKKKDFNLVKAEEVIHVIKTVMDLVGVITLAITGIALLVGGIGIMNVMLLTVKERTREIGIRKAVGAKSWHILAQFLFEAVFLSVTGALLGLAATYGILYSIHTYFPILPNHIPLEMVGYTIVFAIGAGLLFGMIPALRAVRIPPIEALRYE
ncbi:ABC transporter permease [Aneurinibacillus thermoaerophilus]|uniref:ABC transporter permease n=2 Tax=Aneurinibacillus thermoaerophilus TaxID=143495 RepID=UPI002E219889|nr:ABC transporter permease [Aneurinibacillus thermoaerophilus]MED0763907.1 ABC transporter permease [Aneurinibacillus thermoaerophilus]